MRSPELFASLQHSFKVGGERPITNLAIGAWLSEFSCRWSLQCIEGFRSPQHRDEVLCEGPRYRIEINVWSKHKQRAGQPRNALNVKAFSTYNQARIMGLMRIFSAGIACVIGLCAALSQAE